ncbi:MAG: arginine--tRNA ligase [Candidatus Thorarchaeota archaeon]|nr:MAG: arginine--tRNA ligase [Candidatus Thorarchaeota archaeon]
MATTESQFVNPWDSVKNLAVSLLADVTKLDVTRVRESIEIPPDPNLGDLASTVSFQLAKQLKKSPAQIANEIAEKINARLETTMVFERAESRGSYVNLFLNRGRFVKFAIEAANQLGQEYGRTAVYKGHRALIEFPAVNPSKPWHIGHARNAVIGDMLGNVLQTVGYKVARIDYINNLGLQIAQLAWKLLQETENLANIKYDHYLGRLYVDVQKAFETDEKAENEIREIARQLEDPDSEASKKSISMVTACLLAQCQTSYRLGIYHDYQVWESDIAHSGLLEAARNMMLECENVVKLEEGDKAGCIVVKLDTIDEFKDMQEPYKVLFRSDGTRTYTGADVALQMWKFGIVQDPFRYQVFDKQPNGKEVLRTSVKGKKKNIGKFDVVFNVVGSSQAQPQRLVYTILDLLGYKTQSENSHHVAYEFVGLEDTDFSGRKGTWIGYTVDEILDRAVELAHDEVAKRNPDETDEFKGQVATQVGTGAVRYMLLKASPDRKITFRWSEALDFDGDAAPYLQYSHARAQRIIEKAAEETQAETDLTMLSSASEFALAKAIAMFPEEILETVRSLKKTMWGTSFYSNKISSYGYGLANLFSKFYDSCPVLKAEPAIATARLELVKAFRTTMANCLRILGIQAVERM